MVRLNQGPHVQLLQSFKQDLQNHRVQQIQAWLLQGEELVINIRVRAKGEENVCQKRYSN